MVLGVVHIIIDKSKWPIYIETSTNDKVYENRLMLKHINICVLSILLEDIKHNSNL